MQEKNIHADLLVYLHHHLKRFLLHLSKDWEFDWAQIYILFLVSEFVHQRGSQNHKVTKHRFPINSFFIKNLQEVCRPRSGFCCILTSSSTKSKEFGLAATDQILTHQTSTEQEPWAICLHSHSLCPEKGQRNQLSLQISLLLMT